MQSLEPGFNQDLNGTGGITPRTVIESVGSTALPTSRAPLSCRRPAARSVRSSGCPARWSWPASSVPGRRSARSRSTASTRSSGERAPTSTSCGPSTAAATSSRKATCCRRRAPSCNRSSPASTRISMAAGSRPGRHRVLRVDDAGQGCGRLCPVADRQLARPAAQDVRRARHGGQFGAWTPIGAEQMANGGYQGRLEERRRRPVRHLEHRQQRQFPVAKLADARTTAVAIARARIQPGPQRRGGITARTVIESAGSTALATVANAFVVSPTSSALGPQLMMSGALSRSASSATGRRSARSRRRMGRLSGRLEERRPRPVRRLDHRQQRQFPLAGRRGDWRHVVLHVYESSLHQDFNGDGRSVPSRRRSSRSARPA